MSNTRLKVEQGLHVAGANSTFESNVYIYADTFYVGNNFIVAGNLQYANTSVTGDLVPSTPGSGLGNSTARFALWATTIDANTSVAPTSNGVTLGNTYNRWDTYTSNLNSSGVVTLTGNLAVNTTAFVVDATNKRIGVNTAPGVAALTVAGLSTFTGNVAFTGNVSVTGQVTSTGAVSSPSVILTNGGLYTNTAAVSNTSANIIDSFPTALGNAAKLCIFVKDNTTLVHAIEILLIHEGTNVLVTKYAEVYNTSLGTFDATIGGANVNITFTASSTGTYTVKTIRQQML